MFVIYLLVTDQNNMKKKNDKKFDVEKLKQEVINLYSELETGKIPEAKYSDVAEAGRDTIIILRDSDKNILAHYQYLKDGNIIKLNVEE